MVTLETKKAIEAVAARLESMAEGKVTGQIVLMVERGLPTWIRLQQDESLVRDTCKTKKK